MGKRFAVSVLVDYLPTPANRWQEGRWRVAGVVSDSSRAHSGPRRLRMPGQDACLWSGLVVELHRDDAESYYYNLISERPRIFVVCTHTSDGGLHPFIVTLSYDEAASYMESDELVEAVGMPAELYRWVEEFVLEHYVPQPRKKRKRDNWKETTREPRPRA